MKYRGLADKRSRTEGTPDFNALSFVNGPPPALPKAAPRSSDDLYGRRDIANSRVQEEDPDDRPRLGQDKGPLADWEKDKVPLMCNAWKLSSNCPYGAQKCSFMHRAYDPRGRPYQLGDIHGRIPQKYRKPPITCDFWYNGRRCKKTAEECQYAHEDTGWTEINGQPIERKHLPPDPAEPAGQDAPPHLIPFKLQNPPITCSFWLRDPHGCRKSEDSCKYAHWNTGWAPPERDIRGPPVRIDPNLRPRGKLPKFANPPVTCPFWLRSEAGCTKTDEQCKYAHRNTGWAPPGLGSEPLPIDPQLQPRSQSHRVEQNARTFPPLQRTNTDQGLHPETAAISSGSRSQAKKGITCPSWLRDRHGCPKSEEACDYSHKNTGWATPKNRPLDAPVPLDPNQIARFYRDHMGTRLEPKYRNPPITCIAWLRKADGCRKTEFECRYAHKNTGWILENGDEAAPPVKIDRMVKPCNEDHTHADSFQEPVQSLVAIEDAPPIQSPAVTTSSQLNTKIEQFYDLNVSEVFHSGVPGDAKMLERRAMLLYHPEEHPEEIELVTRWLLMHDVQVSNLWHEGAWIPFQQDVSAGKSGIIIAHPDFEGYVELPGFGVVLKQRIRVWSVGLQPPAGYEAGLHAITPELRHDRVGIFPHGGFIYITDDVFEHKPQLALRIVKLFFDKIEQLRSLDGPASPWLEVHDACVLWRLCVRPELMEYLYQKCEDNSAELAAQNPDYLSRAELYQLLTSTNFIEQDHPIEPLSLVQDKYPILSERREIAEHPPLNYFNRLANSQQDANTHMIGYYAAMQSSDMRRAYRYFYVVHTEPMSACAKQWKVSIHNIADVITPEQCIEELSKPSKESLFDFLDWAMEPKVETASDR